MKNIPRILIVLLALDMLGGVAFAFGYSAIGTKRQEEIKLRQELAEENQKTAQFATLRKTLKQAERESGVLDKYFYDPGEESQIKFISVIEAIGTSTTGLLVETTSLDLSSGAEPRFRGEFTLKGTWREMYHFLRLIEEFPGRIIIRHFNVSLLKEKNTGAAPWTGSIGIDLTSLKSM